MIYTHQDTSIGPLLIAGEEQALHAIRFPKNGQPEDAPPGWTRSSRGAVAEAARQLREYFEGRRQEFDLPLAPDGTPFQQAVWRSLPEIPYGETIDYGELPRRVG